MTPSAPSPIELWGGIECTLNRVGDRYHDQLAWNGHRDRPDDLDRLAELGIRTLRYPVLWERVAPDGLDRCDWAWADDRLGRLRRLGIRPVVGLIHHGSGPRHTDLLDPGFGDGLAAYAARVAERYPWVELFTPVNEPLTTARFSALYGHWYPHTREPLAFACAFLNQCRATVLAMRAIRRRLPHARLVQTEDLGKTHSTRPLRYQAEFENERRWLTFDLLCGRIDHRHPLGDYFRFLGVPEAELRWFEENPCPPDVLGINHYLTSERFLDHRLARYPVGTHGGNGRHAYADVEAVRVTAPAGPEALLGEAWARYGRPLAVTEAHLGCTREEQCRWLLEVWRAAGKAREAGANVRAVTAWSLLGVYDWDSLVTQPRGHYEPGAFDVRTGRPRPTALAGLIRELAAGREPDHPALAAPGWWHRPERFCYPPYGRRPAAPAQGPSRPLAITGASGALGRAFARVCAGRGLPYRLLARSEMDITDPAAVAAVLEELRPWAVINAAGYVRVDDAEREADACHRVNAHGTTVLAQACARWGLPLLTFSTDLVFDGRRGTPYRESDPTNPLGVFGRTKAAAEAAVRQHHPAALVVRAGAFFGPWDDRHLLGTILAALARGETPAVPEDLTVSPTYVPDLAHACLDLLLDGEGGVWHLANQGAVTWLELARTAARDAGFDPAAVVGRPAAAFGWPAPRPAFSALGSERGLLLPRLEDALGRYRQERPAPAELAA
jgi:dTDP-4-dehydrorhamnose reductase